MIRLENVNYCPVCGKQLVKKNFLHHYNCQSGDKIEYTIVMCNDNTDHFCKIYDDCGNVESSDDMLFEILGL